MTLVPEDRQIVARNPLGSTLDRSRGFLKTSDGLVDDLTAFVLLQDLQKSPVAESLKPPGLRDHLKFYLNNALGAINSLPLYKFGPLAAAVRDGRPDDEVWDAALDLVQKLVLDGHIHERPATPSEPSRLSHAIPASRRDTLGKSSAHCSSSQFDRTTLERNLMEEVWEYTHRNVGGFYEKYLNKSTWSDSRKAARAAILERVQTLPDDTKEVTMSKWMREAVEVALPDACLTVFTQEDAHKFPRKQSNLDFCFYESANDRDFDYGKVVVLGELKKTHGRNFEETFLQLTKNMYEIFAAQPHRRFIHGFTLQGSFLELWVYDRSGPYSSGAINVSDEVGLGILADSLATYATLTQEEAGYEPTIQVQETGARVTVGGLEAVLGPRISRVKSIVSRATVCYKAVYGSEPVAVKMSWLAGPPNREINLLREATSGRVQNVAKFKASAVICSTRELRAGLDFSGSRYDFSGSRYDLSTFRYDCWASRHYFWALGETDSDNGLERPREEASAEPQPFYHDRTLVLVVTTPVGEPFSSFKSWDELRKAMLDAIIGHKSLCLGHNILHRDISYSNLLIVRSDDAVQGLLIDLDYATKLEGGWQTAVRTDFSGNAPRIGTKMYMAIEVLRGIDHTYRHDLESFYYVLLHMCLWWSQELFQRAGDGRVANKIKEKLLFWEEGSYMGVAGMKEGLAYEPILKVLFEDFHSEALPLAGLCEQLRKVLFLADGSFWGTSDDPERVYGDIIRVFRDYVPSV